MKKIAFFGTPEIAAKSLETLLEINDITVALVVTQPDRPAGRKQQLTESPVKKLALANNITVMQPQSAKSELLEQLKSMTLDGAVVVAYGQILPKEVLTQLNDECINVHYSLLPRWRGAAPVQRAILAGDSETGVCLMKMEAGLDSGPVYVSAKTAILPEDTSGTLMARLEKIGCDLLKKNIVEILSDKIQPIPQADQGVTIAPKINKEEAKIVWSEDALQIERKIRAFSPNPGAYTLLDGARLRIFKTRVIDTGATATAGTIIAATKELLVIKTGKEELALELVQKEGRPILSVAEFMRGVKISAGAVL